MEDKNGSGPQKTAVRFHVTQERLNAVEIGQLLDIQDNPNDARLLAAFMANFVADENGNYLTGDAAKAAVRRVTVGQLMTAFQKITGDLQEVASPNG